MKSIDVPVVETVELIKVRFVRGDGEFSPFRKVEAYYTREGKLLFIEDPINKEDYQG